MEGNVAALQRRITELQRQLYHVRQAYLQAKQQRSDCEDRLAEVGETKMHLDVILHQIVPRIKSGVKAIQGLHKDQLRALRVLRQLPIDAQRAVEVMYIMLKCDAFEELSQLESVCFDENAYRMMLNMDEYLRKMETFDTQLLADRPHVLQYIVQTYFGGIPIHKNDSTFDETPSCHWAGEILRHEDLLGIGRKHSAAVTLPPLRRRPAVLPPQPLAGLGANFARKASRASHLSAFDDRSVASYPLSRPSVPSLLPKANRLPPLPANLPPSGGRVEKLGPARRRSSLPSIVASDGQRAAAVELVFTDGQLPPIPPHVIVGPLSLRTVAQQNRAIGALFRWCVSQLQYAEILRREGPVLDHHSLACQRYSELAIEISRLKRRMDQLNAERQRLEDEIQGLVGQHHVQHLQLAHLLHDQALAPQEEQEQRSTLEAEEAKEWARLKEQWDRHWRELRQRQRALAKEEQAQREALEAEHYAARRKLSEQIHHKLSFILEYISRREMAQDPAELRPAVPLPWY